jgi:hypothetical protein
MFAARACIFHGHVRVDQKLIYANVRMSRSDEPRAAAVHFKLKPGSQIVKPWILAHSFMTMIL